MIRIFFTLVLVGIYSISAAQIDTMYVGTYTSNGSKGVQVYSFDKNSGQPTFLKSIEMSNPSFIARNGNYLYAVSENVDGRIVAFDLNKDSVLNSLSTKGAHPCHVSLSPSQPILIVSNYSGGSLVMYSLDEDGSLNKEEDFMQFNNSSVNLDRQSSSHIHSAFFSPDGQHLFVSDLGADIVYKIEVEKIGAGYKFGSMEIIKTKLGGGPRHVVVNSDGTLVYVVLELTGEIEVFQYKNDRWTSKQLLSIHNSDFSGKQGAADIKMSRDGKYIYATNRGKSNELVVYRVLNDGLLKHIQVMPVMGDSPRNVQLSPNQKWVIVSNQLSGNLTFFKRDTKNGKLSNQNKTEAIPSPVCVIF